MTQLLMPQMNFRDGARRSARPWQELIVDNFAGGGGASLGIELGSGRAVDISINHNPDAVAMHQANHPASRHLCENVWEVDPIKATRGRPVGLAWFSPDCTHFSRAKGGKPVKKTIRGLAWIVLRWAAKKKPRVIVLENVREFRTWGPLNRNHRPIKSRMGHTFVRWMEQLTALGYMVEWKELDAADFGAPTHRKRLFVIARCDGIQIIWPEKTHGKAPSNNGSVENHQRCSRRGHEPGLPGRDRPKRIDDADVSSTGLRGQKLHNRQGNQSRVRPSPLIPYRTAAECIDWSIPCPSIFDRKRPLAEKTMRRIAMGLKRYVLDNPKPFIVQVNHGGDEFRGQETDRPFPTVSSKHGFGIVSPVIVGVGGRAGQSPATGGNDPIGTVTSKNDRAVVTPYLVEVQNGGSQNGTRSVDRPAHTVTANPKGGGMAVMAPMLVQYNGEKSANEARAKNINEPLNVVPTENRHAVIAAHLSQFNGQSIGSDPSEPAQACTSMNKQAVISAWLIKHFGGVVGRPIDEPQPTITARGTQNQVACAYLAKFNHGEKQWGAVDEPLGTITSQGLKFGLVYAFLAKYFGTAIGQEIDGPLHTITGKDRFGLVTVTIDGQLFAIADIGMRMLSPRELARAQGFPDSYILTGTKTSQVHKIGNSVSPPIAAAIVRAVFNETGSEAA